MSNKIEKITVSGDTVYIPNEYYPYETTTTGNIIIEDTITYPLDGTSTYPDTITIPNIGSLGIGTSYPSTSINISSPSTIYNVFDLPRKDMPIKVYVCGRIMTLGILGTNVECAYTGRQLVFEPGIFSFLVAGRNTLSVEYRDEIYHYNIIAYDKKKLEVELVSTINTGQDE